MLTRVSVSHMGLLWIFLWPYSELYCLNVLPHISHTYGLSPVCKWVCCFSVTLCANERSQISHLYGLSWEGLCVILWAASTSAVFALYLHTSHANFLWIKTGQQILICLFRWVLSLYVLSQTSHLYGLDALCTVLRWRYKCGAVDVSKVQPSCGQVFQASSLHCLNPLLSWLLFDLCTSLTWRLRDEILR